MNSQMIIQIPVFKFQNSQRYLICLEYDAANTGNQDFAFGYDNYLDYKSNTCL